MSFFAISYLGLPFRRLRVKGTTVSSFNKWLDFPLVHKPYKNIPSLEQQPVINGTLWYLPAFSNCRGSSVRKAVSLECFSIIGANGRSCPIKKGYERNSHIVIFL